MTRTDIFPTALILLNIGAAVMYLPAWAWRKVLFYGAAAVINFVAAF